jgi:peroxiredoxin
MKSKLHLAAVITLLAIGLGVSLYFFEPPPPEMAPDAPYARLDGSPGNIAQFKGRVLLVNFWATTCAICVAEMPQIVALHQQFKSRGYDTVAVAMSYDPPISVMRFAQSRQLPFDVAIDNTGEIARRFGRIEATPTSVLIDKKGQVVMRIVGKPDFASLRRLIDRLVAEPA